MKSAIVIDGLKVAVILTGSAFATLILSPAILYKWIIRTLAKRFRPDLGKMLDPISTAFANSRDPLGYNVMLSNRFRGKLNMDRMRELIKSRLVTRKENDVLVLPEMQQYVTTWMGYYFFQPDENFEIQNHVIEYTTMEPSLLPHSEDADANAIVQIEQEIINRPFEVKKPLWKFFFLDCSSSNGDCAGTSGDDDACAEVVEPYFHMFVLVSHILGDGVSCFHNMMGRLWDEQPGWPVTAYRTLSNPQRVRSWADRFKFPWKAALEFWPQLFINQARHIWYIAPQRQSPSRVFVKSNLIINSNIKEISKLYGTSFTGAIFGGITGGIRTFLEDRGVALVPETISCMFPLPYESHADGFSNHYAYLNFDFPVGESDVKMRFEKCEKMLQDAKRSTQMVTGALYLKLISNLGILMPKFDDCALDLSVVPGPPSPVYLDGNKSIEVGPAFFHGRGVEIVSLMMTSYNGNTRIMVSCDEVFAKAADELVARILRHFQLDQFEPINTNEDQDQPISYKVNE